MASLRVSVRYLTVLSRPTNTLFPLALRPLVAATLRSTHRSQINKCPGLFSPRFATTIADAAGAFAPPPPPRTRSLFQRLIRFIAIGVLSTTAGFVMATAEAVPAVNELITPPTDAETLELYVPPDEVSAQINEAIKNHPIAQALRKRAGFTETRPYMKIPEPAKAHYLTGGVLSGPGLIWVPPLSFAEECGKSMTTLMYLGNDLSGHPGIVHGGLQATLLDEVIARCCFGALPNHVAVTANLTINYKAPMPTNSYVCAKAELTKVEGRKAWATGRLESMPEEGETPVVYAEASGLFIEPKQAATMARLYPAAASGSAGAAG